MYVYYMKMWKILQKCKVKVLFVILPPSGNYFSFFYMYLPSIMGNAYIIIFYPLLWLHVYIYV